MTAYVPTHDFTQFKAANGQPWNTRYDAGNCWATAGAWAGDWATRGDWKPTPPDIRQLSGNLKQLPGNVGDIKAALQTHDPSIVVHIPPGGASWDVILKRLASGKWSACIATDYDVIPDTKSCQPNFDGDHMLWLPGDQVVHGDGTLAYDDPLCANRKRIDGDVIRAAARKCANHLGVPHLIVAFVKQKAAPGEPAPGDCCDERDALQEQIDAIAAILAPNT